MLVAVKKIQILETFFAVEILIFCDDAANMAARKQDLSRFWSG